MRPQAALLLCLLATAGLAGCAGKATGGTSAPPAASATTGAIRGEVLDAAIHPLGGVRVTLRIGDEARVANTTEGGQFRFPNVPAGSHALRVHRTGYLDVQVQVEAVAGLDDPPLVKVTLDLDPSYVKPFLQPFKFNGLMECSVQANAPPPVGPAAVAACALPSTTVGVSPTNDKFTAVHTLDSGRPTFVQSELVWDPSGPLAKTLLLHMDERNHTAGSPTADTGGAHTGYTELASAYGPSPVIIHLEDAAVGHLGRGYDLQLRVFAWYQDPVPAGAAFEQDFTLYSTIFYGFKPPSGWSIADGLPTVPGS